MSLVVNLHDVIKLIQIMCSLATKLARKTLKLSVLLQCDVTFCYIKQFPYELISPCWTQTHYYQINNDNAVTATGMAILYWSLRRRQRTHFIYYCVLTSTNDLPVVICIKTFHTHILLLLYSWIILRLHVLCAKP